MTPDLSRRLGRALGSRPVDPDDRRAVIDAAETANTWDDLPAPVRSIVRRLERRAGITPA